MVFKTNVKIDLYITPNELLSLEKFQKCDTLHEKCVLLYKELAEHGNLIILYIFRPKGHLF